MSSKLYYPPSQRRSSFPATRTIQEVNFHKHTLTDRSARAKSLPAHELQFLMKRTDSAITLHTTHLPRDTIIAGTSIVNPHITSQYISESQGLERNCVHGQQNQATERSNDPATTSLIQARDQTPDLEIVSSRSIRRIVGTRLPVVAVGKTQQTQRGQLENNDPQMLITGARKVQRSTIATTRQETRPENLQSNVQPFSGIFNTINSSYIVAQPRLHGIRSGHFKDPFSLSEHSVDQVSGSTCNLNQNHRSSPTSSLPKKRVKTEDVAENGFASPNNTNSVAQVHPTSFRQCIN